MAAAILVHLVMSEHIHCGPDETVDDISNNILLNEEIWVSI